MFVAGNIEHYLSLKNLLLPEMRPRQTELVGGKGEPGKGSLFGAFKGLLNVEFFLE